MCLDSAVIVYDKPLREKRVGYKVKPLDIYDSIDYKYRNSGSTIKTETDNNGKGYEPGFHILISRKAATKLARAINKLMSRYSWGSRYCIFKVEYNDTVAEGYEMCNNIVDSVPGRCRCDVARRMKVLKQIEVL